jgi:ATP-dependent DNA helicase RecQ
MDKGASAEALLQRYWGYENFRPLQADIIDSVTGGTDTLALLPTGGGKSICFQVPALMLGGLTLVVSPLIALMRDQVEQLRRRNIPAAAVYSGMAYREIDTILDQAVFGHYRLLYLSPERLQTELFQARLPHMPLQLLAVDEAHCISEWGYEFRPAYLRISEVRAVWPELPCVALTASATRRTCEDIAHRLGFTRGYQFFEKSFDRPNLIYGVSLKEDKRRQLKDFFRRVEGSGIVYVRNRRGTEQLAALLRQAGISAAHYHAGLTHRDRTQRQSDWMQNRFRVMVATNAFGMGIDKPDVRAVAHMDVPDALEAYYQEAGRAGRDGHKAYALLIANESDRRKLLEKKEQVFPEPPMVRRVYHALGNYLQVPLGGGAEVSFDFSLREFARRYQMPAPLVYQALRVLETTGYIAMTESVYLPSRLKFLVDYESLYALQVAQPEFDRLSKALLRTYGGLFEHYTAIREEELARALKRSPAEVAAAINRLAEREIVDYQPQKDTPQLTFLQARLEASHLDIDPPFLRRRRAVLQDKIQAMVDYLWTENTCRTQALLRYFDQQGDYACGHCDLCIRRQKRQAAPQISDNALRKGLQQHLARKKAGLEDLRQAFYRIGEDQLLKNLRAMEDDGLIRRGSDGVYEATHSRSDTASNAR